MRPRACGAALLLAALVAPACHDAGRCAHRPVVMIHGFGGGPRAFDPLIDALRNEGWSPDALAAAAYDPDGSIEAWGRRAAGEAARLHARTGCRAAIVGYSMGGLAARWAVSRGGAAPDVAGVITAGTPHHGTPLAEQCDEPACLEMRAGSAFLADLDAAGDGPPLVSIASRGDQVAPPATARLDGAKNVVVCCPPHNRLFTGEVVDAVREALSDMKGN